MSRLATTSAHEVSFETISIPRHGPMRQPVNGRRGWSGCASTAAPPSARDGAERVLLTLLAG